MSKRIHRQILAGTLCAVAAATPAWAEMDQKTRGSMQYLYKSMLLSEQNLKLAAEKKDFQRASLVNDLLFTYRRLSGDTEASNPCLEALDGLTGAAIAIGFTAHPVTTDPSDRYSKTMRPSQDTLDKWYNEGVALYRSKLATCEEEINYKPTTRLLPEKMPLTR